MPYGHKVRTVRAYEYGCLLPTAGLDAALVQMRGRVHLWNALVELHEPYREERRQLIDRLRAEHGLPPLQREISQADAPGAEPGAEPGDGKRHRKERKAPRGGKVEGKQEKTERLVLTEDERALFKGIDAREHAAVLAAKHSAALYWANGDEVVVSFAAAVKASQGRKLQFHSGRRYGKTTARWQTGLPVAAATGLDGRMRLTAIPSLHAPARSVLQVRVGSQERQPIWLTLPVVMHRPLPADGIIRQVSVISERVGPHDGGNPWLWKAAFVVEIPEEHPVPAGAGLVGIDIGWRRIGADLRVAYWHDDQGRSGDLRLDSRFVAGMRKAEDLRSIRDKQFNGALSLLLRFRASAVVPEWFRDATRFVDKWKSPERLSSLVWKWKDNRFAGDEDVLEGVEGVRGTLNTRERWQPEHGLEAWRRRERHLWAYEVNSKDQLLGRRQDQYRNFAATLARTYGRVALEEFDLRPMAELKQAAGDFTDTVRWDRTVASCSELRLALLNACRREGLEIRVVAARNTTRACSFCGHVEPSSIVELIHRCSGCGEEWDQDWNGARNILQAGLDADRPKAGGG